VFFVAMANHFREGLFKDKVAIVTGGGTGIGKAIAFSLLQLGCCVVISGRREEKLKETVQEVSEVKAEGWGEVEYVVCDIRKEEMVQNMMRFTLSKFKKIDFLVNNGGGQFPSKAEFIRAKGWRSVIDTNLNGTFLCCREAFHHWMGENGGVIVNIVADFFNGFPGMSHTGAARAGVANLTKSLAVEWAQHKIRIVSVAPGVIFSESASKHYEKNTKVPDLLQQALPGIPLGRLGTVEDVSGAVLFLLSPAASFITGDTIKVDGASSLKGPMLDSLLFSPNAKL